MVYLHFTAGQQRIKGITQIVYLHVFGALTIIHPAAVAELALPVKNKGMRRCHRPIGARNLFLIAVIKIGKVELFIFRPDFHFFEGIAQVSVAEFVQADGLGIVRRYGYQRHASGLIIRSDLFQPLFIILRGGAMVAGENDNKDRRSLKVLQ